MLTNTASRRLACALLSIAPAICSPSAAHSASQEVKILGSPWKSNEEPVSYGSTVASSSSHIAVSSVSFREGVQRVAGCVQLFDASGKWLRTIRPPSELIGGRQYFGKSLAIWGEVIVVGSSAGVGGSAGYVTLHRLSTGKVMSRLPAKLGLGDAVAYNGTRLAVSDMMAPHGGAVSLYAVAENLTLTPIAELTDTSLVAGAAFGDITKLDGDLLAISAPRAGTSGRIYLYDSRTGDEVEYFESALAGAGTELGTDLDFNAGTLITSTKDGRAFLYDVMTGEESELPLDLPTSTILHRCSVAIDGNLALVVLRLSSGATMVQGFDVNSANRLFTNHLAVTQDDIPTSGDPVALASGSLVIGDGSFDYGGSLNRGIAYRLSPMLSPLAYDVIVAKGHPAYGTGSGVIQDWIAAAGPSQQCLLTAKLSGRGITASNNSAAYLLLPNHARPESSIITGDNMTGAGTVKKLWNPVINAQGRGLGLAISTQLHSPSFNQGYVWETDSPTPAGALNYTADFTISPQTLVQSISDMPNNIFALSGKAVSMNRSPVPSPATDSHILTRSDDNLPGDPFYQPIREGDEVPSQPGATLGHLGPRVTLYN